LPIEGNTTLLIRYVKSFAEPSPQTLEMNVPNRADTLARSNQRISFDSRLEADPAVDLIGSQNRLNFIFIEIGNIMGRS
jgi:hypothetical protein